MSKKSIAEEKTVKYYDIIYAEWMSEELTSQELGLIKSLAKPGAKILDVGCGSGRHLVPLAQEGYDLTGVEPQSVMVKTLKKKLPDAKIVRASFLDAQIDTGFDLVICMWNSFDEIANTEQKGRQAMKKFWEVIADNGVVLLGNAPAETDRSGLNFDYSRSVNGKKYDLSWRVKDNDTKTGTTVCSERIKVWDEKTGELLDDVEAIIKQKWWTRNQIIRLAEEIGFKVEIKELEAGDDLYYVMRK